MLLNLGFTSVPRFTFILNFINIQTRDKIKLVETCAALLPVPSYYGAKAQAHHDRINYHHYLSYYLLHQRHTHTQCNAGVGG
jgi:hypothetical protein